MKSNPCTALAIVALTLAGCVTVKELYGPDGRPAHAISCSRAMGIDWSDCFAKASELCGARGYKVWNQASNPTAATSEGEDPAFGASSPSGTLLISCKGDQPAGTDEKASK